MIFGRLCERLIDMYVLWLTAFLLVILLGRTVSVQARTFEFCDHSVGSCPGPPTDMLVEGLTFTPDPPIFQQPFQIAITGSLDLVMAVGSTLTWTMGINGNNVVTRIDPLTDYMTLPAGPGQFQFLWPDFLSQQVQGGQYYMSFTFKDSGGREVGCIFFQWQYA